MPFVHNIKEKGFLKKPLFEFHHFLIETDVAFKVYSILEPNECEKTPKTEAAGTQARKAYEVLLWDSDG